MMFSTSFPRRVPIAIRIAAVSVFYAATAFLILHPILFSTGTHTAGFDYFNYNWNFWWMRFSGSTPGLNLYATNFTMFPFTTNLGYHAFTAFWFPFWATLEPMIGTLAAMNTIIFTAATLNGAVMFAWLRREKAAPAFALLGGLALQASPNLRYFYYNTHINLMDWFWLPALLLAWGGLATLVEQKRDGWVLLAASAFGAALWGLGLTDLQFPIFAAFLLAPFGLLTLIRARRRLPLIAMGSIALVIALALLWFAGPLPHMRSFTGTLAPGIAEDRPGIPIPSGFVRMSEQWWEWSQPSIGGWITAVILVALALARPRQTDRRWLWFALMLPPLILSLGPTLYLFGAELPLPFRLLHAVTNGMFRMPWRLAPIAIIAGLTFAALVYSQLAARQRRWMLVAVPCAMLALVADVRFFETAPLSPVPTAYEVYRTIGNERGTPYADQVIIEIPSGAASGEVIFGDPRATQLQWYTTTHEKRIVNGFISRAPLEHFFYLETADPMLSWLGQRRYLEPQAVADQLRERIFGWPIGYFLIHTDLIGPQAPAVNEIVSFFNQHEDLLCPYSSEGALIAYRTRWHPDGCPPRTPPRAAAEPWVIDIGSPDDFRYLGAGWYYPEDIFGTTLRWAGATMQATVYVDLPPQAYALDIVMQAFDSPRTVTILANQIPLDATTLVSVDSLRSYRVELPQSAFTQGQCIELTLTFGDSLPLAQPAIGDSRRLAVAVESFRFTPKMPVGTP